MSDYNIINLNQFSWPLNVAIMGAAFSVFSLIYNDEYIYYGLITVAFGVTTHVIYKFFDWFFKSDETNKKYWVVHLAHFLMVVAWLTVLYCIYY
ncbi:MAG: hypothetical protein COU32_01310 [Candidatus Magasanikbacteria bacterium CG10_big_fil_rev_8_21_14_0_10_42_10]|uniref:Uncharacterized protein n=1 Tax=Candidatus Magasanikbacteria bacterium CG10_big_fil_rev_8_21_14_0_10_42_10 TaxID=1974649 RepID=A0A2H0TWP8_9BACT|nr:MAG: hypothetical protein COU32_01310 [Candidatus Magasanikbacteria bacterium CG10_big_fil_rev_8_21_14_0_10_42_10]